MRFSFWVVAFRWALLVFLFVYFVVDMAKERRVKISISEHYTEQHPELGKYYNVLEPISPQTLKFLLVVLKDSLETETMRLQSALDAGRSGNLTNMFLRIEKGLEQNKQGMKFFEEAILDPVGSSFVPQTKDGDVLCCYWFVHPRYQDFGFIVFRDGKMVCRDPAYGYYNSEALDDIGFESYIKEL